LWEDLPFPYIRHCDGDEELRIFVENQMGMKYLSGRRLNGQPTGHALSHVG